MKDRSKIHIITNRLPLEGSKITYRKKTEFHWFTNIIEAEKRLVIGQEYTVDKIDVASSATYVTLKEFPENGGLGFSLHAFSWDDREISEEEFQYLVGSYYSSLSRLKEPYEFDLREGDYNIYKDGKPIYFASVQPNGIITKIEKIND